MRVSPICTLLLLSSLFMACLPLAEQRHSFLLDLGELEYGMYTQRYFDFSVKIPENWSYEPPAEDQDYADGFRTQALMITDSLPEADQRLWLGQLKGQGQARLGMRADYLQPQAYRQPERSLTHIARQAAAAWPLQSRPLHKIPINGRFYTIAELRQPGGLHRDYYHLSWKDKQFAFTFVLTYQSTEEKQQLLKLIEDVVWRIE